MSLTSVSKESLHTIVIITRIKLKYLQTVKLQFIVYFTNTNTLFQTGLSKNKDIANCGRLGKC